MISRRDFLGLTLAPLWLRQSNDTPRLYRWWPRFPLPREIWVVPPAGDFEEGILLESVMGLAARAAMRTRGNTPMLYEDVPMESYRRAFEAYCAANFPKIVRITLDEAITRLAASGAVKGILLARYDASVRPLHEDGLYNESVNAATSLAASMSGLVVTEKLLPRMESRGLSRLADLREETESSCFAKHESKFSRHLLGTCDPRARHARSLMIALNAFVCSARGEVYRRALSRCRPDSPVLGWGCGAEDGQTIPSSSAGLYQTATDWCHNLPVFASESAASPALSSRLRAPAPAHWSMLDWGDGNHYAALVLSDGDNVQWEMSSFARGPAGASYYDHPLRGKIPFGWGINAPTLAQLAPRVLEDILTRATPRDGFLLFGGAGYFYPDLYGSDRGKGAAMALHGERLRGYMELTGIRSVGLNFQKWDSPAALTACSTLASKMPGLQGIFAIQYYPYSAGEGAIRWVRGAKGDEVPIASCSYCVWARTGRPRDSTPAAVAAQINGLERLGPARAVDRCFSWTLVHAWSYFREADASADPLAEELDIAQDRYSPGTERGYSPALWTARRLAPHVKIVSPAEWLIRIRLRLRPKHTLAGWLAESRAAGKSGLSTCERLFRRVETESTGDGSAARKCFEKLRESWLGG